MISAASDAGRLHPRYRNRLGILTLESVPLRSWPHSVSIDGTVFIFFDENRTLASVELMAPMSAWKGKGAVAQPLGQPGDIRLGNELAGRVACDWPVVVTKDVQRDMARISFGDTDYNRTVALSDCAFALLKDDHLIGFWFSFAR